MTTGQVHLDARTPCQVRHGTAKFMTTFGRSGGVSHSELIDVPDFFAVPNSFNQMREQMRIQRFGDHAIKACGT